MLVFYKHLNIEERDNWIRLLKNCTNWRCKWCLYFFCNNYVKYSFANFLSIFPSFQLLYVVRLAKNMKTDRVSAYVHMRYDIHSPCTQLCTFWITPSIPQQLCTYVNDGPFFNQKTNKDIPISLSLKYNYFKK